MKYERTIRAFVEDLVSSGRRKKWVKTVAHNTRWRNRVDEIMKMYKKVTNKIKRTKIGKVKKCYQ